MNIPNSSYNDKIPYNNKYDLPVLSYKGKFLSCREIANLSGLPVTTVYSRYAKSWCAEDIINTPYNLGRKRSRWDERYQR